MIRKWVDGTSDGVNYSKLTVEEGQEAGVGRARAIAAGKDREISARAREGTSLATRKRRHEY